MFPAASYQYVLFGMGFRMDVSSPAESGYGALAALGAPLAQNASAEGKMEQGVAEESRS